MILILTKYENEILNSTSGTGTYRPARLTFQTKAITGAVLNNLVYPSLKLKGEIKKSIVYGFSFSDKILVNKPQIRKGAKFEVKKGENLVKNELQLIEETIHHNLYLGIILKDSSLVRFIEETLEAGIRLGTKTPLKMPSDIYIYDNIQIGEMNDDTVKITPIPEEQFNYEQFIQDYKLTNLYYHSFTVYDTEGDNVVVKHYIEPYTKGKEAVWTLTPFTNSLVKTHGYLLPDDIIDKLPQSIQKTIIPSRVIV